MDKQAIPFNCPLRSKRPSFETWIASFANGTCPCPTFEPLVMDFGLGDFRQYRHCGILDRQRTVRRLLRQIHVPVRHSALPRPTATGKSMKPFLSSRVALR